MTRRRRVRDWHLAGVSKTLHHVLVPYVQVAGQIDWERASLESARVPALGGGGNVTGKDPTNRCTVGTKRHISVDRHGVPLAVTNSGAYIWKPCKPHYGTQVHWCGGTCRKPSYVMVS